jgi:hypothetical protein
MRNTDIGSLALFTKTLLLLFSCHIAAPKFETIVDRENLRYTNPGSSPVEELRF